MTNRSLTLSGALGTPTKPLYTASRTVQSTDPDVAVGNLKYDITNETAITDTAGNQMADKDVTVIVNTLIDTALPTISTAAYNASTITLTMSEDVTVSGTKTGGDFTISVAGADNPTVSSYTINNNTVTLTLSSAISFGSTVSLAYTKNATAANRITDTAGNELAAVSSQSVVGKSVSVSAVSTDDYINAAEDNNAILIAGSSTDLTTGTTITITLDDADADLNADLTFTATTNSSGAWTTSSSDLTATRLAALDKGEMTITALAPDAESATRTVTYDTTAPTVTSSATGYYTTSALATELSGTVKTGTDIYTKVTFSEAVGNTVADDSTARPVISYALAGTDTQDIIASGSPASGDCVESGSGATDNKQYTCRYTIASGNTGSFSTKVGTNTADLAGNTLASTYTHGDTLTMDTTLPTISTAAYNASTITLTMSEDVTVLGTKTGGDFTVTGGGAPTVSSYTISNRTITLTLSSSIAFGSTVTLAYAKNSTAANRITDTAGNELAAVSSQSVSGKSVSISAVSTDDYINAAEDNSAILIAGSSTDLTTGTTITITIDDSDADTNADITFTDTTDSSGNWTTDSNDLTATRLAALDEGDLTITASASGAEDGIRTVVYDRTTPSKPTALLTLPQAMTPDQATPTTSPRTPLTLPSPVVRRQTAPYNSTEMVQQWAAPTRQTDRAVLHRQNSSPSISRSARRQVPTTSPPKATDAASVTPLLLPAELSLLP